MSTSKSVSVRMGDRTARSLVMALFLVLFGCGSHTRNVLDAVTSDGTSVSALLKREQQNVVLYYPPSYCFACGQEITEWKDLARSGRVNLVILLASEPTDAERRGLVIRRIPVAGVVAVPPDGPLPQEYLVEEGVVRIAALGATKTGRNSPVLTAFRNQPVAKDASR